MWKSLNYLKIHYQYVHYTFHYTIQKGTPLATNHFQLNNSHMETIVFTRLDLRTLLIYSTCMNSQFHLTKLIHITKLLDMCELGLINIHLLV